MRSNSRPALRLSTLRPHQIEMTPGLPSSLVCPDCSVWRRINRSKIQPHFLDDETTYCPASAQRVEKDVTPEQWAAQIEEGVAETAARTATTVLKKVKAPKPQAILHIAQPRPALPEPTAAERAEQWAEVLLPVYVTDARRRIPLHGARGPIVPLALPVGARAIAQTPTADEVLATSPVRKRAAA
ncbi:hypothetical protein [Streptomyces sp. XY431]|uniref:hypothetical protein n=1 Tax=Streptomyces sp. XY431 TaxID=1415562 RepID=UPI0006AE22AA|nr:hypothetical protein [Streptomyces sp. XY431]